MSELIMQLQSSLKGTSTVVDYGRDKKTSTFFSPNPKDVWDRLGSHVKAKFIQAAASKSKTDAFHKYKVESTTQPLVWNSAQQETYNLSIQEEQVFFKALVRSSRLISKGRLRIE